MCSKLDPEGRERCGCCGDTWPSEQLRSDRRNGWICPECYNAFVGPDEDAAELRARARRGSCRSCGSMLRNNVRCEACRHHLMNKGLSNLLEVVMTSRMVQP